MNKQQVKSLYLSLYLFSFITGLIVARYFGLNVFPELGATIIIAAIWRGTQKLRKSNWKFQNWAKKLEEAEEQAFSWDLTAAAIGTAINGYSSIIFWVATLGQK